MGSTCSCLATQQNGVVVANKTKIKEGGDMNCAHDSQPPHHQHHSPTPTFPLSPPSRFSAAAPAHQTPNNKAPLFDDPIGLHARPIDSDDVHQQQSDDEEDLLEDEQSDCPLFISQNPLLHPPSAGSTDMYKPSRRSVCFSPECNAHDSFGTGRRKCSRSFCSGCGTEEERSLHSGDSTYIGLTDVTTDSTSAHSSSAVGLISTRISTDGGFIFVTDEECEEHSMSTEEAVDGEFTNNAVGSLPPVLVKHGTSSNCEDNVFFPIHAEQSERTDVSSTSVNSNGVTFCEDEKEEEVLVETTTLVYELPAALTRNLTPDCAAKESQGDLAVATSASPVPVIATRVLAPRDFTVPLATIAANGLQRPTTMFQPEMCGAVSTAEVRRLSGGDGSTPSVSGFASIASGLRSIYMLAKEGGAQGADDILSGFGQSFISGSSMSELPSSAFSPFNSQMFMDRVAKQRAQRQQDSGDYADSDDDDDDDLFQTTRDDDTMSPINVPLGDVNHAAAPSIGDAKSWRSSVHQQQPTTVTTTRIVLTPHGGYAASSSPTTVVVLD